MERRSEDYEWGYRDGYVAGRWAERDNLPLTRGPAPIPSGPTKPKPKRKRRQSPKQKLLTQLTDKKWKQYRKGSGKKTYIEIRAQVSRSQDYKRKAKRLK